MNIIRMLLFIIISSLNGCGGVGIVVDHQSGESQLETQNVSALDQEDLRLGKLLAIKSRYEHLTSDQRTLPQTALLCDIYIKLQDFSNATLCNAAFTNMAIKDPNATTLVKQAHGRMAQIYLGQKRYREALTALTNLENDGAYYVRGLIKARLGDNAEVLRIAEYFSKQFKPKLVFYAATLYAAVDNCPHTLELLEDPERRLLADYGLTASDTGTGVSATSINAPFRLDPFDDFTFGVFTEHSYAPAANVYVELLAAQCMRRTGRIDEAEQRFKKLLAFPNLPAYRDAHWLVLKELAEIAKANGDRQSGVSYLRQAANAIEQGRSTITTENGRLAFVADKHQIYAALVSELLVDGNVEAALEFVERSKSRGLVDLLASKRDNFAPGDISLAKANSLLDNLSRAETNLSLATLRSAGTDLRESISDLREATSEIIGESPNLAVLVTVVPHTFADIARTIGPEETAILYYHAQDSWVAFVVHTNSVQAISLGTPPLDALVKQFSEAILQKTTDAYKYPARELYSALLQPIMHLVATDRVIIVPHGTLHAVPFAAMLNGDVPLVKSKILRVVPSLSVLAMESSTSPVLPTTPVGLIFGNPAGANLPEAEEEANAIWRIFPASVLYKGNDATLARLRAEQAGKTFLHIASHGIFNEDVPLASGLVFAATNAQQQHILTVADLYSMRLDVTLTVMSACESGLTKVVAGDDVIGLIRGLLFSGVKTVIGSYWEVEDDATKYLMIQLYQGLSSGKTAAEAMQAAQISAMQQFPHPNFWASFAVIGKDAKLVAF